MNNLMVFVLENVENKQKTPELIQILIRFLFIQWSEGVRDLTAVLWSYAVNVTELWRPLDYSVYVDLTVGFLANPVTSTD